MTITRPVTRRIITALTILIGGLGLLWAWLPILNFDLYGRLSETKKAVGVGFGSSNDEDTPKIRLVLHKLPADENAVEASLIVSIEGKLKQAVREGSATVRIMVTDGSSIGVIGLLYDVTLDSKTAENVPSGWNRLTTESQRFFLPTYPSVQGYPFDDLRVRPIIYTYINGPFNNYYELEIHRAFPGRLMDVNADNIATVRLSRSPTEKILVLGASGIFLVLTLILTLGLFTRSRGLSTSEELIAVAGYIVATAGFRELLGVNRLAGTSALEMVVVGLPLLSVSAGVIVSYLRGYKSASLPVVARSARPKAARIVWTISHKPPRRRR